MRPLLPARPVRTAVLTVTLVLTSTLAAAAASPPAVQDKPLVTFGIGPSSAQGSDDRPFLQYGVSPGAVVLDHVAVLNQSDVPLDLQVYAGDGVNTEGGGLDIRKRAERNSDLGAWVTAGDAVRTGALDPTSRSLNRVTVPPQSSTSGRGQVVVPIRIAVPADASPGDHIGGIAASLISRGDNAGAQNIEFEQRVVARVLLRVAGPLEPALSVKILDSKYVGGPGLGLSGSVRVTYRVTNTGNVRIGTSSRVQVDGIAGLTSSSGGGAVAAELVPQGSAVLTATVQDVAPSVLADVEVTADAVPPPGGDLPSAATASDSVRIWAVTWQQLALLLALLLFALWLWWRRHRRVQAQTRQRGRHGRGRSAQLEQHALDVVRPRS